MGYTKMIKHHTSKSRKKTTQEKTGQRYVWETDASRDCGSFTTIAIISMRGLSAYGQASLPGSITISDSFEVRAIRKGRGMYCFLVGNAFVI